MATRGRRPKPTYLRLVDGTNRTSRHGDAEQVRSATQQITGGFKPAEKPKKMASGASNAWDQFIAPATWLDVYREPSAIAFCELYAEFKSSPGRFQASRHAQMRAYMADLGLTDERNRPKRVEKPKDEFFDD